MPKFVALITAAQVYRALCLLAYYAFLLKNDFFGCRSMHDPLTIRRVMMPPVQDGCPVLCDRPVAVDPLLLSRPVLLARPEGDRACNHIIIQVRRYILLTTI